MKEDLLKKIYDATDNGLDIILYYYPQAKGPDGNLRKTFKIRPERTASASVVMIHGVWRVTDFGDTGKALQPVNVCMKEEGKEFREALLTLAQRYGVSPTINAAVNRAKVEKTDATPEQKEGWYEVKVKEKMTEDELELLGPLVTQEVCDKYSYFALEWYRFTKDRKTVTVTANDDYPIFMHDCGEFKKIYQPLAADKAYRFRYLGKKAADYINGLDELKKAHEKWLKQQGDDQELDEAAGDAGETRKKKSKKLPEAVLCSGERDALNTAGLGYLPLWLNSETADLDPAAYAEIMKRVDILYNLPDMDNTGAKAAAELAKKYIDIRTIELPRELTGYMDNRGKPRKDMRDWVDTQISTSRPGESEETRKERFKREKEKTIRKFKEMLEVAKPCRFWEKVNDGKKIRYEINTLYLLYFLKVHGFGKIVDPDNDVVTYVHIDGFKVKLISTRNIQDFIIEWAEKRKLNVGIQNLILNSTRIGNGVFEKIESVNPDFTSFDENSQTIFFRNRVVKVKADSIEESTGPQNGVYAMEKTVCPHDFKRIEPAFTADWETNPGSFSIKTNHIRSHYFRFLINASRIYWREELEDRASREPAKEEAYRKEHHWDIAGPRLTEEEQMEQQRHLVNKLFAVGYMMHSYKSLAKAWGLWVMENKITEEDESGGGSGKTFMIRFLKNFKNTETVNGRDKKLTENNFFMDRVTERTDLLLIDDAVKYFNFNYFYSMITDNMVVNYKNARSKEIPFALSPKIVFTSNFPPPAGDGSTARRLLNCVFSDWYHQATAENDYEETVRIADDFGYELYNAAYKEEWWNEDFNFAADCLQFYLQCSKRNIMLQPPMENVDRRMRNQTMGEDFKEWAEAYFAPGNQIHLDRLLTKSAVKEDYDPKGKMTMKGFTKRLRAFCANAEHIEALNPEECKGWYKGRLIRTMYGDTKEFIYIKTHGTPINDDIDNSI